MARQIGPGTPGEIPVLNIPQPEINLDVLDKLGDAKIKSASQNFELYANTTLKAETQKLYEQHKDNPVALAQALEKLPTIFEGLPENIQNKMKEKLFADGVSLVNKAKANQERAIAKQNKQMAHLGAQYSETQITDDYFNVLRYITAPDEEKRPVDIEIYNQHRGELIALTAMTDENGNPLFSETQIAKMNMPKNAVVGGFKQFIGRMEHDQLKEWDAKIFQNRQKFMADTNIDDDTYDTMETALTKRLSALKNTKDRQLHGQAYYDSATLIAEPTKLNIEKAKASGIIDEDLIDHIVEQSKAVTAEAYYDPNRRTSPAAFLAGLNQFTDAVKNTDWTPQGRTQTLESAANSLTYLNAIAKEANLDPEKVDEIKQTVYKAITDRTAQEALTNSGILELTQHARAIIGDEIAFPESTPETREDFKTLAAKVANTAPLNTRNAPAAMKPAQAFSTLIGYKGAQKKAVRNLESNLEYAVALYMAGKYDEFYKFVQDADRQYKKDQASFIVNNPADWIRLEYALAEGRPAVINYMGRTLEFKGFDNAGPMFVEKM